MEFGTRPQERGVALIVVLLLLVVATVIALSGMRFSSQEILIASNNEQRLSSYQVAQSAIDATLTNGNYTAGNNPGAVACTADLPHVLESVDPDGTGPLTAGQYCNNKLMTIDSLPNSYLASDITDHRLRIAVERLGVGTGQCQRGLQGTSMLNFSCAQYAVLAEYEPSSGGARTTVQQGRTIPQLTPGAAGQ